MFCPKDTDMHRLLKDRGISVIPYDFQMGSIHYYSGGPNIISRTFAKCITDIIKNKNNIIEIIKKSDADLILINSLTTSWIAKYIKQYTNKKVACFIRETFPRKGNIFLKSIFDLILKNYCDEVFFISNYDKNLFFKNNVDKGVVIRNSVPNYFFCEKTKSEACKELNIPENTFNILFVGGMSKLKGTEVIVKAMRGLPDNIRLIIAGYKNENDKYSKSISHFIDTHMLSHVISFIGVQKSMTTAYSCSDVLVFPSTKPHQARPVFEAGAFKKAAIISDFPEISEAINNKVNGMVFEPCNENSLREKILYLYKNYSVNEKMGLNNYKHTLEYHSEDKVQEVLINSLNMVIEKR